MQRAAATLGILLALAPPVAAQVAVVPPTVTSAPASEPSGGPVLPRSTATPTWSLAHDVRSFFSTDTAKVVGAFAIAGLVSTRWDRASVDEAGERLSKPAFWLGNQIGSLYVQAGAAAATFAIGKVSGNSQMLSLGTDLFRAQMLSQIM